MSNSEKKHNSGLRSYILALTLLLAANIIMGTTLVSLSKRTLREQINQRMLDIANTAAYMIDGDELKNITPESEGTEAYNSIYKTLGSFQDNIELSYIYGVKPEEDGTFTFTIDPSDDPGEFGSPIITTPALINASKGYADVDKKAYSDSWGRFYSAYSPVFDSNDKVVGIIAVDFDANWYENKLNTHRATAVVITLITFGIGVFLSYKIISRNRKSFSETLSKLEALDHETQKLDRLIMKNSIKKLDFLPHNESAVLKTLATGEEDKKPLVAKDYSDIDASIETVYNNLKTYMNYIDKEVYNDDFTGTKNKAAYKKRVRSYDADIADGKAAFSIGFVDINDMKIIYTKYGYETGDMIMFECGKLLKEVFGEDNVFHIVGDEFIILKDNATEDDMKKYFDEFDKKTKEYNKTRTSKHDLSVAKGYTAYSADKYDNYRNVFIDTKKACNIDKENYKNRYKTEMNKKIG